MSMRNPVLMDARNDEIIDCLARGLSYAKAAAQLGTSPQCICRRMKNPTMKERLVTRRREIYLELSGQTSHLAPQALQMLRSILAGELQAVPAPPAAPGAPAAPLPEPVAPSVSDRLKAAATILKTTSAMMKDVDVVATLEAMQAKLDALTTPPTAGQPDPAAPPEEGPLDPPDAAPSCPSA